MSEFIKLLVAFVSGGILTPYFTHFLTIKKTKRELNLRYLEEAYELSKQFRNFVAQTPAVISFSIAFLEYKIDRSTFPKFVESPVSRLNTLLDYHLSAPSDLIQQIENLNEEVLVTNRPIAEAINNPDKKSQLYTQAVSLAIDAADKGSHLSSAIIYWIKEEKRKIDSEPTPFHSVYWKNLFIKCWSSIHSSLHKCEGK